MVYTVICNSAIYLVFLTFKSNYAMVVIHDLNINSMYLRHMEKIKRLLYLSVFLTFTYTNLNVEFKSLLFPNMAGSYNTCIITGFITIAFRKQLFSVISFSRKRPLINAYSLKTRQIIWPNSAEKSLISQVYSDTFLLHQVKVQKAVSQVIPKFVQSTLLVHRRAFCQLRHHRIRQTIKPS